MTRGFPHFCREIVDLILGGNRLRVVSQRQNANGLQLLFAPGGQSLGDPACDSRSGAVAPIAEAIAPRSGTVSAPAGF